MKIGMNLLLWTGHVTEEHYPHLERIKAAGFDGVEIPLFQSEEAHYTKLRRQLDQLGLECTAVTISTPEANAQKQYALVGKGNCLVGLGQAQEGLTLLNDLINKNDPADAVLFARTYNALGNAYLKLNRNKDALQSFLFTDLLFYADAESHAEALYHLSKLWNEVNKSDRAVQARNTLRERYSGSIWAAKE